MNLLRCFVLASVLLSTALLAQSDEKSSKSPPKGAPWVTTFVAARTQAMAEGKPIFVYSTKTY